MVLGIQWLSGLGPILWDFKSLTMEFLQRNKKILINGIRVEDSVVDNNLTFLQELRRANRTNMGTMS